MPDFEYQNIFCTTSGTIPFSASTTIDITSSTLPGVENGFTYGEILQTYFLFILACTQIAVFLWFWLRGIKVKH